MRTLLKDAFVDKNNQEALFSGIGQDLDYTIVRPVGLTDGRKSDIYVVSNGSGTIPRESVADFCLQAVTRDDFPYSQQSPCISSKRTGHGDKVFSTISSEN